MWYSHPSRRAALLALAALAGCGFVPVHGTNGALAPLWGQVAFDLPDTAAGFRMRRHLQDRLGLPQSPRFALDVDLDISQAAFAIGSDNSATRMRVDGVATFDLSENGKMRVQGEVSNFTAFSLSGSTVATAAARDDAVDRLMEILADLIVAQIAATLTP